MDYPSDIFTYAGLRKFLTTVAREVEIFPLREWQGRPGLILRHDVDLAIEPALKLAELEIECGISSTFFIMATNQWYNPASPRNRSMLRQMVDNGFEIGLHFDVLAVSGESSVERRERLDLEAEVLASVTGAKIVSVSLHNPSISGEYPLFEGYNNAYDPRCFGPGRYVSDSRMFFREDLKGLTRRAKAETVQLLLHPLHYSISGGGYDEIFYDTMQRLFEAIDAEWRNNTSYADAIKHGLLSYFIHRVTHSST